MYFADENIARAWVYFDHTNNIGQNLGNGRNDRYGARYTSAL